MNIFVRLLASLFQSLGARKAVSSVQLSSTPEKTVKPYEGFKIVLDPGHGGRRGKRDPGAVGHVDSEEIYERDVVLKICEQLAFKLDSLGFEVVLTRVDNDPGAKSTLGAKVRIVKVEKPDLFVSIHANANAGTPAQGIETFYHSGRNESIDLARCIQANLMDNFPTHKDRGVKNGSHLYVLRSTTVKAECLVECEFINHPKQVKFLLQNPERIAEAISKGIQKYLIKVQGGANND